jgi:glycosyltransferase involved in cell wall biosynthesis
MKILIVTTFGFDPAFPSRPEQMQARALAERGHMVIAHEYLDRRYQGQSTRHEWLPGPIAVHRAAPLGFFAPEALLRTITIDRPDLVHIHHLRNLLAFQAVQIARRLGLPVLMTIHGLLHDGDLVADRERPLEAPLRFTNLLQTPAQLAARLARGAHPRRAFRNYLIHAPVQQLDHAIALSQHEASLLPHLGLRPEQISVLPNAVDLSGYGETTPALGSPHAPLVLFIGQLVPRKGYDLLARAMPQILTAVPTARFIFVSHNRSDEAELRRIVSEAGIADRFELRGRVSEAEKRRLLQEAAVVAVPSRYEGFGIPLIEALAAGAAVVTTDVPAGNEIIRHEQTGLLTPYGDIAALAESIVRLLQDHRLAQRLAATGKREVFERYRADRLAGDLELLYEQLVRRKLPAAPC